MACRLTPKEQLQASGPVAEDISDCSRCLELQAHELPAK